MNEDEDFTSSEKDFFQKGEEMGGENKGEGQAPAKNIEDAADRILKKGEKLKSEDIMVIAEIFKDFTEDNPKVKHLKATIKIVALDLKYGGRLSKELSDGIAGELFGQMFSVGTELLGLGMSPGASVAFNAFKAAIFNIKATVNNFTKGRGGEEGVSTLINSLDDARRKEQSSLCDVKKA